MLRNKHSSQQGNFLQMQGQNNLKKEESNQDCIYQYRKSNYSCQCFDPRFCQQNQQEQQEQSKNISKSRRKGGELQEQNQRQELQKQNQNNQGKNLRCQNLEDCQDQQEECQEKNLKIQKDISKQKEQQFQEGNQLHHQNSPSQQIQQFKQKKKAIAIVTIDIGEGNSDQIQVCQGDDLREVVKRFCQKHLLKADVVHCITQSIEDTLLQRKQNKFQVINHANNNVNISSESPKFFKEKQLEINQQKITFEQNLQYPLQEQEEIIENTFENQLLSMNASIPEEFSSNLFDTKSTEKPCLKINEKQGAKKDNLQGDMDNKFTHQQFNNSNILLNEEITCSLQKINLQNNIQTEPAQGDDLGVDDIYSEKELSFVQYEENKSLPDQKRIKDKIQQLLNFKDKMHPCQKFLNQENKQTILFNCNIGSLHQQQETDSLSKLGQSSHHTKKVQNSFFDQKNHERSFKNNNNGDDQIDDSKILNKKSEEQQSYEKWQKLLKKKLKNQNYFNHYHHRRSPINSQSQIKILESFNITSELKKKPLKGQILINDSSFSPKMLKNNNNQSSLSINNNFQSLQYLPKEQQQQPLSFNRWPYLKSDAEVGLSNKFYEQDIKQRNKSKQQYEDNKQNLLKKEVSESSFHPNILPESKNIKQKVGMKIEDYSILEGKKQDERKAIAQFIREEQKIADCHFQPKISQIRNKLEQDKQEQNDYTQIHQKLFKQGVEYQAIKQQWSTQKFQGLHPFSPDLRGITQNKKISKKIQENFSKRLEKERVYYDQKNIVQKQFEKNNVDQVASQLFLHPKIDKDEVSNRVSQRTDLQDKLLKDINAKSKNNIPINSNAIVKKIKNISPKGVGSMYQYPNSERIIYLNSNESKLMKGRGQISKSATPNRKNQKLLKKGYHSFNENISFTTNSKKSENFMNKYPSFSSKEVGMDQFQTSPLDNFSRFSFSIQQQPQSQQQCEQDNQQNQRRNYYETQKSIELHQILNQQFVNSYTQQPTLIDKGDNLKNKINQEHLNYQVEKLFIDDQQLFQFISELFDEFDFDKDGKISSFAINIQRTNTTILKLIYDLLIEIDQKNLILTKSDFIQYLSSFDLIHPLKQVKFIFIEQILQFTSSIFQQVFY